MLYAYRLRNKFRGLSMELVIEADSLEFVYGYSDNYNQVEVVREITREEAEGIMYKRFMVWTIYQLPKQEPWYKKAIKELGWKFKGMFGSKELVLWQK